MGEVATVPGVPSIAVVVATCGRAEVLLNMLDDLCADAPETAELVVVDQSSGRDRERIVEWFTQCSDVRLRRVEHPEPNLPAARNVGVEVTSAPILLFLDDDVRIFRGCVSAHIASYADPQVGGVVGRIVERRAPANAQRTRCEVTRSGRVRTWLGGDVAMRVRSLKGANMSLRREALSAAGGFDPDWGGTAFLEEADVAERVRGCGWILLFAPAAAVLHLSTLTGGVRQPDRESTEWWRFHNTARFIRKHRGYQALPLMGMTFGAIAVKRSVEWRKPRVLTSLVSALVTGWRQGASRVKGEPSSLGS